MRATRFRLGAGSLSWEKKDRTAAKNQSILDVIPTQYKDQAVNLIKGCCDLRKAEIFPRDEKCVARLDRIKDGAMKKPEQGSKAKRASC